MTIKELSTITEQQRMRMGVNKPTLCKEIGISIMTYETFLKGTRKLHAKSLHLIIMFMERMGRRIPDIIL